MATPAGPSGGRQNVMFSIDTSDAQYKIEQVRNALSEKNFKTVMRRVLQRAPGGVRAVLKKEIPKEYKAMPMWVSRQVGGAKMTNAADASCVIPVDGARGWLKINSGQGVFQTKPTKKNSRRYKLNAQIVKGKMSELPTKVEKDGKGNIRGAHFMVFSDKYNGRVFARMSARRTDIRPAVGIGVPQMPTNRAEEKVQERIGDMLLKRVEQEYRNMMSEIADGKRKH